MDANLQNNIYIHIYIPGRIGRTLLLLFELPFTIGNAPAPNRNYFLIDWFIPLKVTIIQNHFHLTRIDKVCNPELFTEKLDAPNNDDVHPSTF